MYLRDPNNFKTEKNIIAKKPKSNDYGTNLVDQIIKQKL